MRQAFAVEALVDLEPGSDPRALGGAVTLALCGAFDHPGPCPLAPHHTSVERTDDAVRARVVLGCEPDRRETVIRTLTDALEAGSLVDPDGVEQRWRLRWCGLTALREVEQELARRLVAMPG